MDLDVQKPKRPFVVRWLTCQTSEDRCDRKNLHHQTHLQSINCLNDELEIIRNGEIFREPPRYRNDLSSSPPNVSELCASRGSRFHSRFVTAPALRHHRISGKWEPSDGPTSPMRGNIGGYNAARLTFDSRCWRPMPVWSIAASVVRRWTSLPGTGNQCARSQRAVYPTVRQDRAGASSMFYRSVQCRCGSLQDTSCGQEASWSIVRQVAGRRQ